MTKVLIADDHLLFVDGVAAVLQKYNDIKIVGKVVNGLEVLEYLKNTTVNLVILDINMPKLDGLKTLAIIKKDYPNIKVLLVSMYNTNEFVVQARTIGAHGFILKECGGKELVMAIRKITTGGRYYSLRVDEKYDSILFDKEQEKIELSEREIDVIIKLAEGYTSIETGNLLHISKYTVDAHRRNIFAKLDIKNVVQLTRYAIKKKYVDL